MSKKSIYETPSSQVVEFELRGVFCTSERVGDIDPLQEKYDWTDMWNNN